MGQFSSTRNTNAPLPQADCLWKTCVNVNESTFNWEIENFTFCPQKRGEELLGPTFSTEDSKEKWRLVVYVRGNNWENKDYVSIFLELVESERQIVGAKFSLSVKSYVRGRSIKRDKRSLCNFRKGSLWGWPKFIKRSSLKPKNGLLHNDKITIVCYVAMTGDTVSLARQLSATSAAHQTNLAKLLNSEKFSDCTLSVAGKQFNAHKAILSAHSPVFAAMFEHDTKESQTGSVAIEDTEPAVMKEMLHFLYTGSAPNLKSLADRLLVLADKYQVEPLKRICEESMCEQLSVENACAMLAQAHRLSASRLKSCAVKFIMAQPEAVSKSEGFKSLGQQYPELVVETFQTIK